MFATMQRLAVGARQQACLVMLMALSISALSPACAVADKPMKWEPDVATAFEKAKQQGRPIFLMMTAEWCGPCKSLEKNTLSKAIVQSALKDYVCVKAYEDKEIEQKFGLNGYPTLLFIDSDGEQVHHRTAGSREVGPFLKVVIEALEKGNQEIPGPLQRLVEKAFTPDRRQIEQFIAAGDGKGLLDYMQPVNEDSLRSQNYLLVKVNLPAGIDRTEVLLLDSNNSNYPITESGFLCIAGQASSDTFELRTVAKGCRTKTVKVKLPAGKAVTTKVVDIERLTNKDAIRLVGQVKLPNGQPAAGAIVRLLDWDWVKADDRGQFVLTDVSAGSYTLRAEFPGGEYQQELQLTPRTKKLELKLEPAATVGIRWALQTEAKNPQLTGESVVQGEAYFSIKHSRFSLARGAEVRRAWGSDFMLRDDVTHVAQSLSAEKLSAIQNAADPKFFFWLFDAALHRSGLHREQAAFEQIESVGQGVDFNADQYFEFMRGDLLEPGAVFTVRCVETDRFAKLEIIALSRPLGQQ